MKGECRVCHHNTDVNFSGLCLTCEQEEAYKLFLKWEYIRTGIWKEERPSLPKPNPNP